MILMVKSTGFQRKSIHDAYARPPLSLSLILWNKFTSKTRRDGGGKDDVLFIWTDDSLLLDDCQTATGTVQCSPHQPPRLASRQDTLYRD
jgi:hypothetical protein